MENENVLQMLDKFCKLLELGNVPKVIDEMKTTILMLDRELQKKNGKVILPVVIPQLFGTQLKENITREELIQVQQKQNEIINFINHRFC